MQYGTWLLQPGHNSSVSGKSYSQYGHKDVASSSSSAFPPDFLNKKIGKISYVGWEFGIFL